MLFDKGTNRKAFFMGQADKCRCPSDLLAAYLFAKLEQQERILAKLPDQKTRDEAGPR